MPRFQFKSQAIFWAAAVISLLSLLALIARMVLDGDPWRKTDSWEGRMVGMSEDEVTAALGAPLAQSSGHYGLPDAAFVKLHPVAKTLLFQQSGGTVYVSFEPVGNKWIAFSSSYLPQGAVY
jgi:hypothetical protein